MQIDFRSNESKKKSHIQRRRHLTSKLQHTCLIHQGSQLHQSRLLAQKRCRSQFKLKTNLFQETTMKMRVVKGINQTNQIRRLSGKGSKMMRLIKLLKNSHKNKIFYRQMRRTTMVSLIKRKRNNQTFQIQLWSKQHLGIIHRPKDSTRIKNKLGRITVIAPHRQLIISPFHQARKLLEMVRI